MDNFYLQATDGVGLTPNRCRCDTLNGVGVTPNNIIIIYLKDIYTLNAFNRGIKMKAYKITFRNYVVGTDAIERSVTVKGWIRKCVTLHSLQRDKKLIVSVDKVDIQ